LLLNIIEFSTCRYASDKQGISVVKECGRQFPYGYTIMMSVALFALVAGLLYNVALGVHLYREKISNILHEQYIRKKEIEYVVGISEMWLTRHFFFFSSFRSEVFKMYHRVFYNTVFVLLCFVHGIMEESTAKTGLVMAVFGALSLLVVVTRPYRCGVSNAILLILSITMAANCFMFIFKKSGMRSALFVDNYFTVLLLLLNGFGWFLVLILLLFALAVRQKWPLDKEQAQKGILGQELAIIYIKQARKFRKQVVESKRYDEPEQRQMEFLLS
jgi:hypothetical protein